ncbi:hypothetical protein BB560_005309 [Smittium megazygosporum]|uniref:Saccharopine dehydrogenase [NAD(+), L-lysine-forming] n=1 Tax=Smittium megazygosporum TaxID=133381 RepID=A0A2T9Z6Z5_9FUNG|nr:hypothetical protein BB560_005309 [Smittium megazygosporum]
MSPAAVHLWLRDETKPLEHRSALSPEVCSLLISKGFKITVEKSADRIFDLQEYVDTGCEIAESGAWKSAPLDVIVIGLKELPETDTFPLVHKHIMFAHAYKYQTGWQHVLKRFVEGKGTLYDFEFLVDDSKRRVAAFGFYAGFTGAAVGVSSWCHQQLSPNTELPTINPYPNEDVLISQLKADLSKVGKFPRVIVIGALGRCGSGAVSLFRKAGIPEENIIQWDMKETAKGGPFKEITEADIFVNCIYLTSKIPPFIDQALINSIDRKLSVVVDVSCDPNNPNNPIPIYSSWTTFESPLLDVPTSSGPRLQLCAIDHLPSMLPREASIQFSKDLTPNLLELANVDTYPVWTRAKQIFEDKAKEATTN